MKKTTITFSISIITAFIALGAFFFFINIIKNKNEHSSAVLTILDSKLAKKENADLLQKKVSELDTTRKTIDSYFIDPANIDSFVSSLEDLGTEAGANISVKDVEIATTQKNSILVKLSATGSFDNVMKAVLLVENAPYQLHITQISLNSNVSPTDPTAKKKPASTWQADVSFTVLST